ncbi:MAG: hypothetical protein D3925_15610 [Candidatus Electrothrix sp. AR5]|nr:hypothetical protein [Candidatus Electrothrix sp. AR5]
MELTGVAEKAGLKRTYIMQSTKKMGVSILPDKLNSIFAAIPIPNVSRKNWISKKNLDGYPKIQLDCLGGRC